MTVHPSEATNPDASRYVELTRQGKARYVATNRRGGSIEVGEGDDAAFTPVELLLSALAACTAMDVDYIVGKRAEAESGRLSSSARKVRDGAGNHLVDIEVVLDLRYPEDAGGDAARSILPIALERSNDRLCTVGRTVQLGTPVLVTLARPSELSDD
ncbi:OsmC family protein [Marmoricola sp. URHB0036]|uniref:OsmC family protein n=1 Tax=Marmoricola sp. URHB0036 TaxID=1298863 RepID=UPI0004048DB3|nr:OsmC family protein [Marmoricola sp. URHB0036]